MSGKTILGLVVVGAIVWHFAAGAETTVPQVGFQDSYGNQWVFPPKSGRPMVVSFWICNCAYSTRNLQVMALAREEFENEADWMTFYMNPANTQELENSAQQVGNTLPYAAMQQSNEVLLGLHNGFKLEAPGRDIFIIDKKGRFIAVSTRSVTDDPQHMAHTAKKVAEKLREALKA